MIANGSLVFSGTPAQLEASTDPLVQQFIENFAQFEDHVDEAVRQSAPKAA